MAHLMGLEPEGALLTSHPLMPGSPLTALAGGKSPILFETTKGYATVLGNRADEHQKAFMELLGAAAIHLAYVL